MRSLRAVWVPFFLVLCFLSVVAAQVSSPQASESDNAAPATITQLPAATSPAAPSSFDQVIDRIVEREHFFVAQMRHMHPLVETYIQNMKSDKEMGAVPIGDHYFLGRLDMSNGTDDRAFVGRPGFGRRMLNTLTSVYTMHFLPLGFAQMVMLDDDFQHKFYDFTFVRREFLGEIRCMVHRRAAQKDQRARVASWDASGSRIRTTTLFASTAPILRMRAQLLPSL